MLSLRAAAARSHGKITYETLSKINAGQHSGRLQTRTAEGLAQALDVPLSEVYAAAEAVQPLSSWQMPEATWGLDASERREIEKMARLLLNAKEAGIAIGMERARSNTRSGTQGDGGS